MQVQDKVMIAAACPLVYQHLNDPELVTACTPWLKQVKINTTERNFQAVIPFVMGQFRAQIGVKLWWLDGVTNEALRLSGVLVSGGSTVPIQTQLTFTPLTPQQTEIGWLIAASVPEKMRPVVAQFVGDTPQRFAAAFFICLQEKLLSHRSFLT